MSTLRAQWQSASNNDMEWGARKWEDSFTTVEATTNGQNNNENQGN